MLTDHPDLLSLPDPEAEPFKITDEMMQQVTSHVSTRHVLTTLSNVENFIALSGNDIGSTEYVCISSLQQYHMHP